MAVATVERTEAEVQPVPTPLAERRLPWGGVSGGADGKLRTAEELLELSGLAGWNVQKKEIYVGRKGKKIPERYATVRQTDGQPLGIVGLGYHVLQTEAAFAFGDNLQDSGSAHWERAGIFKGGGIVFAAMEFEEGIRVPGDDSELRPYLLIVNSFDGSTPFEGILTTVRVVCQNTLAMARGTKTPHKIRLRHTSGFDGRIAQAREILGISFEHFKEFGQLAERLALKELVDDQVREILRTAVWPMNPDLPEGRIESHPSTLAFQHYLTSETLDGTRGTAWGVLNAVTEFVDHEQTYRSRRDSDADSVRGQAVLFGIGEERKERALAALIKESKS